MHGRSTMETGTMARVGPIKQLALPRKVQVKITRLEVGHNRLPLNLAQLQDKELAVLSNKLDLKPAAGVELQTRGIISLEDQMKHQRHPIRTLNSPQ
jgi:hypothetical protein